MDINTYIAKIPHFFRHAVDLLHLASYESRFRVDSLELEWSTYKQKDLDALVQLLGFKKGQVILEKKTPIPIEKALESLVLKLSEATKGMEIDFQQWLQHHGQHEPIFVLDLVLGDECFHPCHPNGGSGSLEHARFLSNRETIVKNLDDCRYFSQPNTRQTVGAQGQPNITDIERFLDLVDVMLAENKWFPLSMVNFSEAMTFLTLAQKIIIICADGSTSSSAALYLRFHQERIFGSPRGGSLSGPPSIVFLNRGIGSFYVE